MTNMFPFFFHQTNTIKFEFYIKKKKGKNEEEEDFFPNLSLEG